jgi:hypothetical protein
MSSRWLHDVSRTVLRLLLLAVGAAVGLLALVMGLLFTLGLVGWALLRGRRPVRLSAFRWRGAPQPGRATGRAEVIDIEAREVGKG